MASSTSAPASNPAKAEPLAPSSRPSAIGAALSWFPVLLTAGIAAAALVLSLEQDEIPEETRDLQSQQTFISYLLNEDSLTGLSGDALNLEQRDRICFAIAHGLIEAPSVYYGFSDTGDSFDKLYNPTVTTPEEKALEYFNNTGCSARIPTMPSNFRNFQ